MARWSNKDELRLVGYAAGNLGKNLVWSATDVTLLFMLTDLLGISAAAAATLMLLAVGGDLLFDLVFGTIVARGRAIGFGYRWFIMAGTVPCAAMFALLYSLPWIGEARFWLIALAVISFRGGYALIDVPHNALIASVAPNSHARGRVSGYRLFFSSIASLAVATILTPAVENAHGSDLRLLLALLGLIAALVFCAAMFLSATATRKLPPTRPGDRGVRSLATALLPRLDRQFAAFAGIALTLGFAMPMFGRMMLYFTSYVLGDPLLASPALTALTLGQLAGVLFWTSLVRHFEKAMLLIAGHLVTVTGLALVATFGTSQVPLFACSALVGVGLASVYMLPWGLLADAVDFSEFRYGERRETAIFATFLVIVKASGALSSASIGWVLGVLGYMPGAEQNGVARTGMTVLALGVPIVGGLISSLILFRLPISHRRHAVVINALARRR